ncbi:uncharacterized protein LOC142337423 isoform X3 [Convolutriloba macropyga]|uniref:uncharacterized protein LOC142337423 isoform X3 n=1 Tax=Convolutriloba macropyga TaxID=536237 RepID=UPI003F51F4D8
MPLKSSPCEEKEKYDMFKRNWDNKLDNDNALSSFISSVYASQTNSLTGTNNSTTNNNNNNINVVSPSNLSPTDFAKLLGGSRSRTGKVSGGVFDSSGVRPGNITPDAKLKATPQIPSPQTFAQSPAIPNMSPLAHSQPPLHAQSSLSLTPPSSFNSYGSASTPQSVGGPLSGSSLSPEDDYHNHLPLTKRISRQVNQMNQMNRELQFSSSVNSPSGSLNGSQVSIDINGVCGNQANGPTSQARSSEGMLFVPNDRSTVIVPQYAGMATPQSTGFFDQRKDSNSSMSYQSGHESVPKVVLDKVASNANATQQGSQSNDKLQHSRRELELLTSAASQLLKSTSSSNDVDSSQNSSDHITIAAQELQKSIVQFLQQRQQQNQGQQAERNQAPPPPPQRLPAPVTTQQVVGGGAGQRPPRLYTPTATSPIAGQSSAYGASNPSVDAFKIYNHQLTSSHAPSPPRVNRRGQSSQGGTTNLQITNIPGVQSHAGIRTLRAPPKLFDPTKTNNCSAEGQGTGRTNHQSVHLASGSSLSSFSTSNVSPANIAPSAAFVTNPNLPDLPPLEKVEDIGCKVLPSVEHQSQDEYSHRHQTSISPSASISSSTTTAAVAFGSSTASYVASASSVGGDTMVQGFFAASSTTSKPTPSVSSGRTRTNSLPSSNCNEIVDLLTLPFSSSNQMTSDGDSCDAGTNKPCYNRFVPSVNISSNGASFAIINQSHYYDGSRSSGKTDRAGNLVDLVKQNNKRPGPALPTSTSGSGSKQSSGNSARNGDSKERRSKSSKKRKTSTSEDACTMVEASVTVTSTKVVHTRTTSNSTIGSSSCTFSRKKLSLSSSSEGCSGSSTSSVSNSGSASGSGAGAGTGSRERSSASTGSSRKDGERQACINMLLGLSDKGQNALRLKQSKVRFEQEAEATAVDDGKNNNIVHSGQFMSSRVWSTRGGKNGGVGDSEKQLKILKELKSNYFPDLKHLFTHIINQAYHVRSLISPKWKSFRGIDLDLPFKVRLNNLIWRCWHLQFLKKNKHPMCRFIVPSGKEHNHSTAQAHVLEGKYWRRQDSAVISEYMSWRWYYKIKRSRLLENAKLGRGRGTAAERFVGLQFPKQHHNLPETFVGGSNADFIQNNLSQFHLVLPVDLMDIEPFQPMTPLNFDILDDIEKIGCLDVSEADTNSSVSNFFSPKPGDQDNLTSVEGLDNSVKTVMSSIDSNDDPSGLLKDAALSASSLSPPHSAHSANSIGGVGVANCGVMDDVNHHMAAPSSLSDSSQLSVNSNSGLNPSTSPGGFMHQSFLGPQDTQPHQLPNPVCNDLLVSGTATGPLDLMGTAANGGALSFNNGERHKFRLKMEPNDNCAATTNDVVYLDVTLGNKRISSHQGPSLNTGLHGVHGNFGYGRSGHEGDSRGASSDPLFSSAVVRNTSAADVEVLPQTDVGAVPVYDNSDMARGVGLSVVSLGQSGAGKRQFSVGALNQSDDNEDEADFSEGSDSGSTTDEQQLVGGSSSAHLREIGGRSSKRQQTVINMQSHLPTFAENVLNGSGGIGTSLTQLQSTAVPTGAGPSGNGNLLPNQLNAMLAAYPAAYSSLAQSQNTTSNSSPSGGIRVTNGSEGVGGGIPVTNGLQFLVNGSSDHSTAALLSTGGSVIQLQAHNSVGAAPHIVTPGTPTGAESSPIALIMRHQSQFQNNPLITGPNLAQTPHLQRLTAASLTSPSPSSSGVVTGGGGNSESAFAAATISQNAPLLKGILGQVSSPGGTSTSSGRPGSSFQPPSDNKYVEHEEMKSVYDNIDPCVVKYQRLRDKTAEELTMHKERREKVHQMSERKRRHNIQVALNNLQEKLPPNSDHSKQCKTRAVILTRASDYIESMEEERDNLRRNIFQLRAELHRVNHDIQQIQRLLPAGQGIADQCGGTPDQIAAAGGLGGSGNSASGGNGSAVLRQQFQNYMSENSHHGWSFFIFSHLARRFFDSFVNCVKLQSLESFSESVSNWVQSHCTMVNIRGVVTESLTEMCGKEMPYASTAVSIAPVSVVTGGTPAPSSLSVSPVQPSGGGAGAVPLLQAQQQSQSVLPRMYVTPQTGSMLESPNQVAPPVVVSMGGGGHLNNQHHHQHHHHLNSISNNPSAAGLPRRQSMPATMALTHSQMEHLLPSVVPAATTAPNHHLTSHQQSPTRASEY